MFCRRRTSRPRPLRPSPLVPVPADLSAPVDLRCSAAGPQRRILWSRAPCREGTDERGVLMLDDDEHESRFATPYRGHRKQSFREFFKIETCTDTSTVSDSNDWSLNGHVCFPSRRSCYGQRGKRMLFSMILSNKPLL